ncbi:MAG: SAM-dependent chlorinase/fluorinase [Gammaproteobacteria bacterium]|nr:SAM-dependent chlorinase/fluorinase [Gammaproteobacteria bacterium]
MIALFTDYGLTGPYLGQVQVALFDLVPRARVISLMVDAPAHNPKASAYLLSAFTGDLPEDTVVFSVIDPGVGSDQHRPVIIRVNNKWYVGPDNGLFDLVCRGADTLQAWEITWQPHKLSNTFHGRDLYAPVSAMLDKGDPPPGIIYQWQDRHHWPDDLKEVIYIDQFGNCMTGIHSAQIPETAKLELCGKTFNHASTFSDVQEGEGFWYVNSSGLVEIAYNQVSAAVQLGVKIHDSIKVQ